MPLTLSILWSAASGAALAALGAVLLGRRQRSVAALLFAAFALAWGAQVLMAAAAQATEHATAIRANLALVPLVYLFLAWFVTVFPQGQATRAATGVRLGFLAPAAAVPVVLLAAPPLLVGDLAPTSQGGFARYGPLEPVLLGAPFFLAFDIAVVWLLRHHLRGRGAGRHQTKLLLAGFLLFVSYNNAAILLRRLASPEVQAAIGPSAVTQSVLAALGVALTVGVALRLGRVRPPAGPDRLLLACALAPAGVAALELVWGAVGLPRFSTLGVWRLGTVALVGYAVARYQLFDLEVRLRGLSARALPLAMAALAGAVTLTALEGALPREAPWLAVAAALPTGVLAWRGREAAARWLVPAPVPDEGYLRHRQREVYRAALERTLGGSPTPEDEAVLASLRRAFGIGEEEHGALAHEAARAVARPPGAPEVPEALRRYRIERLLGEGAHGRAFLAHDLEADREVVVKVVGMAALGGRAAALLAREARVLARLQHPHVVRLLDFHEGADEAFLVLEFAEGGSLAGLLEQRGRLGLGEACALLDQILAGLEAAHAAGVVHRDLKPENVLLGRDGAAKLADFGLARDPRLAAIGLTEAGAGTLLYMSPEQVRGEPADARSDLYAAGVLFHRLLTGSYYLRIAGKDDFEVRRLIVEGGPKLALDDQPPWVAAFLARALAKDPAQRFPSTAAMRRALAAAGQALRAPAPKDSSAAGAIGAA